MRLKDLSPRGSSSSGGGGAGKRKRRQLLIEPPPSPPPGRACEDELGERTRSDDEKKCQMFEERNPLAGNKCRLENSTTLAKISNRPSGNNNSQRDHHQDQHHHRETSSTSVIMRHTKQARGALDDIRQQENNCCRVSGASKFSKRELGGGDDDYDDDGGPGQQRQWWKSTTKKSASAAATKRTTKRKSELTSFLTILFGSLLAGLLLVGGGPHSLVTCDGGPRNASAATLAQPLNGTATKLPASSLQANGTLVEKPAREMHSSLATAAAAAAPPPSEDYDSADDTPTHESSADESPHKTRLGGLLAASASDGADLLINHLQASAGSNQPETEAAGATAGETGDEDEEANQLAPSPATGSPGANDEEPREMAATTSSTSSSTARQPGNGSLPVASPLGTSSGSSTTNQTAGEPADEELPAHMDQTTRDAMRVYAKWRLAADDLIELFSRKMMPIIIEHGYDVDSGTVGGLLQVFNGIRALKPWALKLLDASTKLAPGVLVGTQADFGDFDECLNIRVEDPSGLATPPSGSDPADPNEYFPPSQVDPLTGLRSTTLVGRYCLADVEFPKPRRRVRPVPLSAQGQIWFGENSTLNEFEPIELRRPLLDFAQFPSYKSTIFVETGNFFHMLYVDPIRVGVCLTNKIDPLNFQQVVNKLLDEFKITINFHGRCVTKYDKPVWTTYQLVSAYVLVVVCGLVLVSTLLDLAHRKLLKFPCPRGWLKARARLQIAATRHRALFTSFSLVRNTRRLFRPNGGVATAAAATAGPHQHAAAVSCVPQQQQQHAGSVTATSATTTTSNATNSTSCSLADSSVESSPAIERRASSDSAAASSMNDLISHSSFSQLVRASSSEHEQAAKNREFPNNNNNQQQLINLASLHGIRVITMTWMIVNHTYMFGGFFVLWAHRRLIDIAEWPKSLSFQMVLNGWLTVETYFFLSALIIVLTVMPLMRARKFNYFAYVFHRLLRLLPAYVGLVCLNFLWPLISGGPVWLVKGKSFVQTPCEENLWTNFLFINNWIWPEKQCMVHTWFLSADFQLYILAPVIVYLLYRRPAWGHSLNLLVAVLASVLSGFVIYANKLLPTTLINKLEFDAIKQQLSYSYFATYQHMGPYCLGILTGYLLHKRPQVHLPKYLTWLLWILLPPLSFTTLLLTYLWNGAYDDPSLINPSPLVSAFYVAIHRTIWTALVAWLVFACTTGRARLLSSFLSHSLFLPISRLSYSIYLVHLPVIMFRSLNLRHSLEWTDQNILWEACGNFVVSIFMGFFLNVAFESPIVNLENVFMRRTSAIGSAPSATCHMGGPASQKHQQIFHTNKLSLVTNGLNKPVDILHDHKQQVSSQNFSYPNSTSISSTSSASDTSEDQHHILASDDGATTKDSSPEQMRVNKSMARSEDPDQRQRKSLRPKQTSSVERIFGDKRQVLSNGIQVASDNIEQHEMILRDDIEFKQEATTTSMSSSNSSEDQQQQLALLRSQEARLLAERSIKRQHRMSQSSGLDPQYIQSLRLDRSRNSGELQDGDDTIYNISDEYRHYAPAGYQQWRRVMNASASHNLRPNGQTNSMIGLSSGRPQQYATLARSSRLHRDPSHGNSGLHMASSHQNNYTHHARNLMTPQRLSGALPSFGSSTYHQASSHHGQLFPNSSELGGGGGGGSVGYGNLGEQQQSRFALDSESYQNMHSLDVLARRRRQGRYNTLTGTGTRDWRSQLGQPMGREDLLSSWDSPNSWLAGTSSNGGTSSLLIPRIDSSTLRRQQARASSLMGQQQQQQPQLQQESLDSKIVEEPAAEESSAL